MIRSSGVFRNEFRFSMPSKNTGIRLTSLKNARAVMRICSLNLMQSRFGTTNRNTRNNASFIFHQFQMFGSTIDQVVAGTV